MNNKWGEVESLKIYTLLDDYAGYESQFWATHGVSFLLEVKFQGITKRILSDVGPDERVILHNMEIFGISPESIDIITLSHAHYDHTKGLLGFLKEAKKEIPIVAHPLLFRKNFINRPYFREIGIGLKNSKEEIEKYGGILILTREPMNLVEGVIISGEVERITDFEARGIGTYNLNEEGYLEKDRLLDDFSVAVNIKDKGIVIITGCAHSGIVNISKHFKKLFDSDNIIGIIGGLHLVSSTKEQIEKTVEGLKKFPLKWLYPGHCTGFPAQVALYNAFPKKYGILHSGLVVKE